MRVQLKIGWKPMKSGALQLTNYQIGNKAYNEGDDHFIYFNQTYHQENPILIYKKPQRKR